MNANSKMSELAEVHNTYLITKQQVPKPIQEVIIEPGRSEKNYWSDIWRYRELFYILSWRDIKVRYKQTVIGALWSIIRPLLTTIIFTFIFSRVAGIKYPGNAPYAIMVFAGMLAWQFFSNSLSEASGSLIGNSNLITKVYFPRIIIPASSLITSLIDFFVAFIIMLGMFAWFRYVPSWHIVFLPLFIVHVFFCAFGIALYLTAVNVKYRDFRYILPFVVQIGLYITPIGFPSSVITEKFRIIYGLNPMVGVIDGFRWCLLGDELYMPSFLLSIGISLLFMLIGISYFRKMERTFADNI